MKYVGIVIIALVLMQTPVMAEDNHALTQEILAMDKQLFDAFNGNDIDVLKELFHPELEFFHDTGGLADYAATIQNSENLLGKPSSPTRTLIEDSVEVFPMQDIGALQTGRHQFCNTATGSLDCGVFQFIHLWKKEPGGWKLFRVISYDH